MTAAAPRRFAHTRWTVRLGNVFLTLLRRLLYLIVRTRVTPEEVASLRVDPQRPLCFVLQDRHLSSLLVLEQEAPRAGLPLPLAPVGPEFPAIERSVFSVILNRNPLSARTADPSVALARMAAALSREPALDVQLMPVTILWGRSPESQDSLVKALFADAWASVGPLRQLLIIVLHGRQTRVSFGEPISLRRLIDGEADEAAAVRKADRDLRLHFRRVREAAIGPDLSHRRNLIDAIVASAVMQDEIADEARRLGVATEAAEDRARKFAWEIASDFSYPVIRAGELVLQRLWRRLYDGVEVHHGNDLAIRAGQRFVHSPNHRSHIDYPLLSISSMPRLAPPHIAAEPESSDRSGAGAAAPLPAPQLMGRAALRGGLPRVSARDAGEGVPHRLFHRGRSQPQRTHPRAEGRAARDDPRELHARASAAAADGAGVFQL
jgi:glycerol-3-phosphate O-acyltransferase